MNISERSANGRYKTQTAKSVAGISVRNLDHKLTKSMTMQKIACNKLRTVQFIASYTKSDKNKTESFVIFQSIDFTAF